MKILGSLFVAPDDALNVKEGGLGPALKIGDLSIHFRSEGKLLELLDHITAYLAKDDSELDPAAEACREVGMGASNADMAG